MKRVQHTYIQRNHAAAEKVFPLLCPVREADWIPDWKYRLVYSKTGVAELGCVFTTPNNDGSETTWVVTEYDPVNRRIAFAWVWPRMIATRLSIRLEPGAAETKSHISYEYTALSEAGEREMEGYGEEWFAAKMNGWESAINHYLRTGQMIEPATQKARE